MKRTSHGLPLALAILSGVSLSKAEPPKKIPGLLFGGSPAHGQKSQAPLDPRIPTGAVRTRTERPAWAPQRTCSFRRPLCVHARSESDPRIPALLNSLETAYDRLVLVMGVPAPLPDGALGGGPELDYYLEAPQSDEPQRVEADPSLDAEDRSSAFCVGSSVSPDLAEALQCLGEASASGIDAGETPQTRAALATHLRWIAEGPSLTDLEALDDDQSNPGLAVLQRDLESPADAVRGALWFEYVERRHAQAEPGKAALAAWALSGQSTPSDAWRWVNEPDVLDVFRSSAGDQPVDFAHWVADFGATRAFLGSRDTGPGLPVLRCAGDFGRVEFDWTFAYSSLPRRVASSRALEALGSVYLWLDLDTDNEGDRLGFEAQWERPVSFKWTLIKIGADGRDRGRLELPYVEAATEVRDQLLDFHQARGILIVGTNLGGVDLAHPFDPDYQPWEPHAATVYVTQL